MPNTYEELREALSILRQLQTARGMAERFCAKHKIQIVEGNLERTLQAALFPPPPERCKGPT